MNKRFVTNGLCENQIKAIKRHLIRLFEEEKCYLNSRITINNVAQNANTNRQYVSIVLNTFYKQSFSNFLNKYRVQYAIDMLEKEAQNGLSMSILMEQVAKESGFASLSSFYENFKKITHQTPLQYKKSVQKKLKKY